MRIFSRLSLAFVAQIALAQTTSCNGPNPFEVLLFTKTNGFDHNTRSETNELLTDIGLSENFTVTATQDASIFDDSLTLANMEVVIFANTSGNNLRNALCWCVEAEAAVSPTADPLATVQVSFREGPDRAFIELPQGYAPAEVQIVNALGQVVQHLTVQQLATEIDLAPLQLGWYSLHFNDRRIQTVLFIFIHR